MKLIPSCLITFSTNQRIFNKPPQIKKVNSKIKRLLPKHPAYMDTHNY